MQYWPWWASGLALSAVMVFHWLALHRMMAVSGRVTALVDRFRHGAPDPHPQMTPEQMLAALKAATAEEFGALPPSDPPAPDQKPVDLAKLTPLPPRTTSEHLIFFFGLVLGGATAAAASGRLSTVMGLRGQSFAEITGGSTFPTLGLLALGGLLVGFGTRMSGGCTSGHGLCGTSRLQPGSLVATLSFFGVGILVSLALEALL